MERVGVRELRNYASRVVARARAGERIVITVDGVPAAEIGPVSGPSQDRTVEELINAGLVLAPRDRTGPVPRAHPVKLTGTRSVSDVVLRERREG